MTRDELEHIIRASGDITDQYEFVIVGSQSMLGPVPNPLTGSAPPAAQGASGARRKRCFCYESRLAARYG